MVSVVMPMLRGGRLYNVNLSDNLYHAEENLKMSDGIFKFSGAIIKRMDFTMWIVHYGCVMESLALRNFLFIEFMMIMICFLSEKER